MNTTIRTRVRMLLLMALAGLLIVISFTAFFFVQQEKMKEKQQQLSDATIASQKVDYQMALVRFSEQSYLLDPSDKKAEKVLSGVQEIIKDAAGYQQDFQTYEKVSSEFKKMEEKASTYEAEFKPLAGMYKQIGYSETEGLMKILGDIDKQFTEIISTTNKQQLSEQLTRLKQNESQYLATKEEASYDAFVKEVNEFSSLVDASDLKEEDKQEVSRGLLKYQSAMDTIHSSSQKTALILKEFEKIATDVEKSTALVKEDVSALQQALLEQQNNSRQMLIWSMILISAIVIAITLITGILLIRSIARSINTLREGTQIIGEGDLAYRVPIDTNDEMGELAATFNEMAAKMETAFRSVLHASDRLSSSSQHLAAISEETTAQSNEVNEAIRQVASGSQDQAAQIEESNHILKTVSDSIESTARAVYEIETSAGHAEKEGKAGMQVVSGLQNSSEQFLQLASQLTSQVQEVSEQSSRITKIVQTIQEISENTDLLALNAAIESARAGEAGKGFAVVAQEVRKLAERSKGEAQSIKELVQTMSSRMNELSEEAKQFNELRELQSNSVTQTNLAFAKIVDHISNIHDKASDVSQSVQNVQTSNGMLAEKLTEVSAISEEAAATSEQVSASSENQIHAIEQVSKAAFDLQNISQLLHTEVEQFKLSEQDNLEMTTPEDRNDKDTDDVMVEEPEENIEAEETEAPMAVEERKET